MANVEVTVTPIVHEVDIVVDNSSTPHEVVVNKSYNTSSILVEGTTPPVEIEVLKQEHVVNIEVAGGSGGADNRVPGFGGNTNIVTNYRSEFELDDYIYSGYNLNFIPVIQKTINNIELFAEDVTDLTTDWNNRLNLIYV